MTYKSARWKIRIELLGMFPFVLLGKIWGGLFPLKTPTSVFLFFSSADVGGAIKVNADITNCVAAEKPVVIFSKKPKNNDFKGLFAIEGVQAIDLHKRIDNKLFHFMSFFYRGVLSQWINKSPNPVVFGGECLFFYKVIPHVKKNTTRIELCHLDTWLHYNIGFIRMITYRVFSTKKLMEDVRSQYKENNIAQEFYNRLLFIENKIDIPAYQEIQNKRLEVVYIGRGAPQKRVHLIAAIAQKLEDLKVGVHFTFVGDVEKIINVNDFPFCSFLGNVKDEATMKSIYRNSDVLILTSAYEGLPLVVMEMMAYGKTVLSTAVNAIPDYIAHLENGLLITATKENEIIEQGVALIRLLLSDSNLRLEMGKRSREIARQKFNGELFCNQYRKLFFGN